MLKTRMLSYRREAALQVEHCPVISSGPAFDVVKRQDGKLWPIINPISEETLMAGVEKE